MKDAKTSSASHKNSTEYFPNALELTERDSLKAETLKQRGNIESKLGNWKAAQMYYEDCLEILIKIGYLSEVGAVYNSIGCNYFKSGKMSRAREWYNKALRAARQSGDTQLMLDVESNLSLLSGTNCCRILHMHQKRLYHRSRYDLSHHANSDISTLSTRKSPIIFPLIMVDIKYRKDKI